MSLKHLLHFKFRVALVLHVSGVSASPQSRLRKTPWRKLLDFLACAATDTQWPPVIDYSQCDATRHITMLIQLGWTVKGGDETISGGWDRQGGLLLRTNEWLCRGNGSFGVGACLSHWRGCNTKQQPSQCSLPPQHGLSSWWHLKTCSQRTSRLNSEWVDVSTAKLPAARQRENTGNKEPAELQNM